MRNGNVEGTLLKIFELRLLPFGSDIDAVEVPLIDQRLHSRVARELRRIFEHPLDANPLPVRQSLPVVVNHVDVPHVLSRPIKISKRSELRKRATEYFWGRLPQKCL